MHDAPLSTHFQNFFQVKLAYTQDLLECIYRIRYDVYCQEFHYEREEDCPGGLEKDKYDKYSVHALIVHRSTGLNAGCVRLIKPPVEDTSLLLPVEQHCGFNLTDEIRHPNCFPRNTVGEVSRLAVHTNFRKRLGEFESRFGQLSQPLTLTERRTFPLLSVALFAVSTALTVLAQRPEAFVMVEPPLAKRLQAVGIPFVQIGELVDYHGLRAAFYVRNQKALDDMNDTMRELYKFVYDSLEAEVERAGLDLVTWNARG